MKPRLILPLIILLIVLAFWIGPWISSRERLEMPEAVLTTEASSLSDSNRLELKAELQARQKELYRVEQQLKQAREKLAPSSVTSVDQTEEMRANLEQIEVQLKDSKLTGLGLSHARDTSTVVWRERLNSLQQFLLLQERVDLPKLPTYDQQLVSRLGGDTQARTYTVDYQYLHNTWLELASRQSENFDAKLFDQNKRLARVVMLRYQILQYLSEVNWMALFEGSSPWLQDCQLEIYSYPDRKRTFYLLAYSMLEKQVGGGRAVYLALTWQFGKALLALLVLVGCLVWVNRREDARAKASNGIIWAWLAAWLLCQFGLIIVSGDVADALRPVFTLIGIYILFRAYSYLITGALWPMIVDSYLGQKLGISSRIRRDLVLWGRLLCLGEVFKAVILAIAGKGLLAIIVALLVGILIKICFWLWSWTWRVELGNALALIMPGSPRLARSAGDLCASNILGVFLAPLAVVLVFFLTLLHGVMRHLVHYQWAKRMSAGVLRRWMESAAQEQSGFQCVDNSYCQAFSRLIWSPAESWQQSNPNFLLELAQPIENWLDSLTSEQKTDSLMVVHGPYGSGREQVADYLYNAFAPRVRVICMRLSRRLLSETELLDKIAEILALPGKVTKDNIAELLNGQPATLLIIPKAQQLFLARVGGFAAIQLLQQLIMLCRDRLFCCLVLATQSQSYLHLALAERWIVLQSLRLPAWSDLALKDMLLARHQAAGGELHYAAAVLRAAEATPGVSVESYFFYLLREASGGNPAVACELWLEAARIEVNTGHVVIGLPPRKPATILSSLPASAVYVLAEVMRHGELTRQEAAEVTNLPSAQFFTVWERCCEVGILVESDVLGFSINHGWLEAVSRFLQERNLLDGN